MGSDFYNIARFVTKIYFRLFTNLLKGGRNGICREIYEGNGAVSPGLLTVLIIQPSKNYLLMTEVDNMKSGRKYAF